MNDMRDTVARALAAEGLLMSDRKLERWRCGVFATGKKLLLRSDVSGAAGHNDGVLAATRSLSVADSLLPRVLGFGWHQTDGLAALAATPFPVRAKVARLGALFNLGIVLFDLLCDRFPQRARSLFEYVTPAALTARLAGIADVVPASGDVAIDELHKLIANFFQQSHALGGSDAEVRAFASLMRAMYIGEHASTTARRKSGEATIDTWRNLRRKSALPMRTLALLVLRAHAEADRDRRASTLAAARVAGDAIWIVDDLADLEDDWQAGCWSRPLWLLDRTGGGTMHDPAEAFHAVIECGIAAAEACRLADRLQRLRRIAGDYAPAFFISIQATVQVWLDEMH